MDRVLITGVTGFIGLHLARALVDQGTTVHALVRPEARKDRIADLGQRITVHGVDPDMESVRAAVTIAEPDVCVHLATHFVAQHGLEDIDELAESNIAFPMRVAEALAQTGRVRMVNVGTAWQHVGGELYRPKGLYAATKQAFDDVLASYAWSNQLEVVSLRLFDTYGPNDPRAKVVAALMNAAIAGTPIEMGSGESLTDLVHVDDVVQAVLEAVRVPVTAAAPPARYAVSSGAPLRIRELAEIIGRVCGREIDARWGARPDRPDEMLTPWDAGPGLPVWTPKVALEDGLRALASTGAP